MHHVRDIYLHYVQFQGNTAVRTVRCAAAGYRGGVPKHRAATDNGMAGALIEKFLTARSAIAPMLAEPNVLSTQISQFLHGHDAMVLDISKDWMRVRGADQY